MTQVLLLHSVIDPASELTIAFFRKFSEYSGFDLKVVKTSDVTKRDLEGCDIIITIRSQNYYEYLLLKYAKSLGKLCGTFLDDNFFAIPNYKLRRRIHFKALSGCIRVSDLLFSTNDTLGAKMESMSDNGSFIKVDTPVNAIDIGPFNNNQKAGELSLVYYVNDGSMDVFESVIRPVISITESMQNLKVKWNFIGISPDINECSLDNVKVFPHMGLDEFKYTLRNSGFSLGLAPLVDTEFARSKYINKFVEFTMAGIPCIYSNVEPYSSFIDDGFNGVLVENDPIEWAKKIGDLSSLGKRSAITRNAVNTLLKKMSYERVFGNIIKNEPRLNSFKADRKNGNIIRWWYYKIIALMASIADPFIRAYARLRIDGLASLFSYTFGKIRRSIRHG